ncbi:acyl-CoA-binding protein [Hymenobacter sp. 15J16-1T3B]|uniref:acyl-CoA-binding protein n=1 Tax=Hymenobacter sp. 15J16-1T3B TaxID=2886941 RepID=UPI001D1055CD|nr:acyl-CoA-binding protein [Hymenobacter sp. 15J16-1T3B]MCC3158813.1 acyl-CoA-binding protein [Hymenobacter sp. 15J16-1T3B]
MSLQDQLSLQQQFEAAVSRVDGLPGDKAAAHMNDLYGLYKQATEGDHDTKRDEVGDDTPDNPNGPKGMSQAQWDSWSKFKGVSQDDAKRQYIEKVNELAGPVGEAATAITGIGQPATGSQVGSGGQVPGNEAPAPGTAKAPYENEGGQSMGGLRGDINAGAPYGGEDQLKTQQ